MTEDQRRRVRRRARNRCEYCQLPQAAIRPRHQIEHVVAIQHGGGDEPSNLALACMYWKSQT
jgi:5-methylcytosine-specific restriction endonuclease McrA